MTTIYDADILLVDDNPDLLALVADNLHTAGYKTVRTAASCADAKTAFARRRPELMILDINLPDGDGFGLFRDLHAGSDVPALFLSARDADADRLFGLGLGADDYLTKPFLMQELLLRVQHILQRAYRAELCRPRTVAMGSVTVDLQDAAVHRAEGTAALTATERAILQKLADERGHIVTYDALCEAVWGADYYGYENSLKRTHPPFAGENRGRSRPPAVACDRPGHRLQTGRGDVKLKTFTRMIRRYVLATAAVVLLVVGLLLGLTVYLGLHYGETSDDRARIGTLAEALTPTADGLQFDTTQTPAQWMQGYAWAMVLDGNGTVIWQYDLPQNLNKRYTASEIASFSRWYLDDWPVFCWTADYGLFVAAQPRGSVWKYNIYSSAALMYAAAAGLLPTLGVLLAAVVGCCVFFSWRGARQLRAIAAGLDTIADGGTVELPTTGYAGELADAVNRASEQLRRRKEIIARRDDARTNWIAGVSHDVRTPLALILGWAEQLEQDAALPAAVRQKAGDIRTQSEKLRALIEDLNLTSKLQYGAQPLRRQPVQAGPLLRRLAAEFCESPLAAGCDMAVENLLNNAARHNAPGVHITLAAVLRENALELTVADDGAGYPAAVLHALQTGETGANTPHILGLHVVEQIAQAHGGSVQFMQNAPQGAKAVVTLPTENQAHR